MPGPTAGGRVLRSAPARTDSRIFTDVKGTVLLNRTLLAGALLALFSPLTASAQQPAPPSTDTTSPTADMKLDPYGNNVGIAQQTARAKGLQARILWMDAGANVGNLNSVEKIQDVVNKTKAAGMNMIVLDVKPIVGDTIYPSKFAPKLTAWKGKTVAADFDVLRHVLDAAHAVRLPVYANMSTFGEGHKFVNRGLAYVKTDWQTILYEADRSVSSMGAYAPIPFTNDVPTREDQLAAVTNASFLGKDRPGYTAVVLNFDARVIGVYDGATFAQQKIAIPLRGSALLGKGRGSDWLKRFAPVGQILSFAASPKYVPVVQAPEQKYTIFCDPNHPEVRQHEWDIVREVVTNYDVDGMVFDDRLRYAAVNADFGPRSRAAFEQYVGRPLRWPDDVFRTSPYPGQGNIPGPAYQQWLNWRSGVVKSWLDEAARIVRSVRPQAQVAVYVGSWYGDYEKVASNWAGPDFAAPYRWLTPEYQKTAYAATLDWLTTGCYYENATLAEAVATGGSPGATVEGAGQLSNLVVSDAAWTYAGLYAMSYQGATDKFARALRAAAASSQGVMVFDMSQIIDYDWWHVMGEAFAAAPAQAPNTVPGLLDDVRRQHAAQRAQGVAPPPLPPFVGVQDTGF